MKIAIGIYTINEQIPLSFFHNSITLTDQIKDRTFTFISFEGIRSSTEILNKFFTIAVENEFDHLIIWNPKVIIPPVEIKTLTDQAVQAVFSVPLVIGIVNGHPVFNFSYTESSKDFDFIKVDFITLDFLVIPKKILESIKNICEDKNLFYYEMDKKVYSVFQNRIEDRQLITEFDSFKRLLDEAGFEIFVNPKIQATTNITHQAGIIL